MILGLFGLASLGYLTMRTNLLALNGLNQENLGWSTSQLQLELDRFRRTLAEFRAGDEHATVERVNNRFDVLWSRVALTQDGSVGTRLRELDAESGTIPLLLATLQENEALVTGLSPGDFASADRLAAAFAGLDIPVRDFARRVFHNEDEALASVRDKLRASVFFTAFVSFIAFAISGVSLWFLNRESAANRKMAARNLKLARAAEEANATKSRFLTMMSHELRTPMNGVLGMLALAKQRGLPEPQKRVIEQAERSGRQMISMLSDILDYAALQDERMVLEQKPFEPRKLAEAIEELFGAVARREGISLEVGCNDDCPHRLVGDIRRLRQIVAHFASYIVDTAATSNIVISMTHDEGDIAVTISFEYGDAGSDDPHWKPEILLGARPSDMDKFATDSLGPAVARGILERMGGRVWLDYSDDNRIAIILRAPAPVFRTDQIIAHIETKSESLKTICRMALSGEEVVFHEDGALGPVLVVLLEAGGAGESERLDAVRASHPNAVLVALGDPVSPAEFDEVVPVPLNIERLRASVIQTFDEDPKEIASHA